MLQNNKPKEDLKLLSEFNMKDHNKLLLKKEQEYKPKLLPKEPPFNKLKEEQKFKLK